MIGYPITSDAHVFKAEPRDYRVRTRVGTGGTWREVGGVFATRKEAAAYLKKRIGA